jgi:hypothetical protein
VPPRKYQKKHTTNASGQAFPVLVTQQRNFFSEASHFLSLKFFCSKPAKKLTPLFLYP